ncbi:MAG: hypothetical protein PVG39_21560 [Desulfobacteraceae bacterium]|jgi:hypothetical protein
MITNHEASKEILENLENCIRSLNEAILIAQRKCKPEEYESFKQSAGIFIGEIDYILIKPIHDNHPDLVPEAMK